jgi:hypothetical protein
MMITMEYKFVVQVEVTVEIICLWDVTPYSLVYVSHEAVIFKLPSLPCASWGPKNPADFPRTCADITDISLA